MSNELESRFLGVNSYTSRAGTSAKIKKSRTMRPKRWAGSPVGGGKVRTAAPVPQAKPKRRSA